MRVYPDQTIPRGYAIAYSKYFPARDGGAHVEIVRICWPRGLHLVPRLWMIVRETPGLLLDFWRKCPDDVATRCPCLQCQAKRAAAARLVGADARKAADLLNGALECACGNFVVGQDLEALESFGWRQIDSRWKCSECCGTGRQFAARFRTRPLEEPND